jgi:hypothetical protein
VLEALAELCEQQESLAAAFGAQSSSLETPGNQFTKPQVDTDEHGSTPRRAVREAA